MALGMSLRHSDGDHDPRAAPGIAQDLNLATYMPGALPHAVDAKSRWFHAAHAAATVAYFEDHRASPIRQPDANALGAGMADSVGQSLLGDPEQVGFALFR